MLFLFELFDLLCGMEYGFGYYERRKKAEELLDRWLDGRDILCGQETRQAILKDLEKLRDRELD